MSPEIPAKKRIVQFDESIKQSLQNFTAIHGQVVVHVNFISNDWQYSGIRIWPSTYLIALESDHKSKILNVVNINWYPTYMQLKGPVTPFTLIFEGLPKSCTQFDLVEEIPQAGGFEYLNIKRNQSDIYHIELS